jgi:hypothetical protein
MSANDDFPRGWALSTGPVGSPNNCSITIPAVAGITRVLTVVQLNGINLSGGAIYTIVAGPNSVYIGHLDVETPGQTEIDWGGKLAGALGGAMFVQVNNLVVQAGHELFLAIQGYDI